MADFQKITEKLSESRKGKKPPNFEKWSKAAKGKSYYHNKETKEEGRFLPSEVPHGWEKGRLKVKCSCGKSVDIPNLSKYHTNCSSQGKINH